MTAYGIAGYLSTGGITYFEESREAFGLGDNDVLIGFFHLGMPKGEIPDLEAQTDGAKSSVE